MEADFKLNEHDRQKKYVGPVRVMRIIGLVNSSLYHLRVILSLSTIFLLGYMPQNIAFILLLCFIIIFLLYSLLVHDFYNCLSISPTKA